MDKDTEWIRNVIKTNYNTCPPFTYENPLLDKNIANLLASTLTDLIYSKVLSAQCEFRTLITRKIRKLCRNKPDGHISIDDDITDILLLCYEEFQKKPDSPPSIDEMLDTFLIQGMKELNISAKHAKLYTPETIQAIANLKENKKDVAHVILKYINWNTYDASKESLHFDILKSICDIDTLPDYDGIPGTQSDTVVSDDAAIKMKPLIEKLLLSICYEILYTQIVDLKDWCESNRNLQYLVKMCSISSEWFQICSSIMNSLFIKVNFDKQMFQFINMFINEFVKLQHSMVYFSTLYPMHLSHIVTLLDINIDDLPEQIEESYIMSTIEHLRKLHKECDCDLIMLLSHFDAWFPIYYQYAQEMPLSSLTESNHS